MSGAQESLALAPDSATETPRERPFIEPGWYRDLSNEEYHGSYGTSSSQLKTLTEKTPAHLAHGMATPTGPSDAMMLGTAVHTLVLEPGKFENDIAVAPVLNLRTKAGREARDTFELENAGKTVITEAQFDQARAMADSVLAHPMAAVLLQDCVVESSIYWWYRSMDPDDDSRYKEMLKVRPDAICRAHPVVIDLKSAIDGSFTGFSKSINNFYYHLSAAMYLEGVNQCKPLLEAMGHFAYPKFVHIVVENREPYLTSVYELSEQYLEIGKVLYRRNLQVLRHARENDWPGYPEEIRVIEPPGWANRFHVV